MFTCSSSGGLKLSSKEILKIAKLLYTVCERGSKYHSENQLKSAWKAKILEMFLDTE